MDCKKLASGDNEKITQSTDMKESTSHEILRDKSQDQIEVDTTDNMRNPHAGYKEKVNQDAISPKMIDENETKLKERVAQCKTIIEKLKLELTEEKIKLEKEAKEFQPQPEEIPHRSSLNNAYTFEKQTDFTDLYSEKMFSDSVDGKLNCDENLMEYEKQLQRYQYTLNMAQIEKKNAIRKQMLAKAFKLKLMEVENQCNIEILRIKQSLQCLEPLRMIVDKWKDHSNDNVYDLNNFELIPRFPDANSVSDITNTSGTDDFENKIAILNRIEKHE